MSSGHRVHFTQKTADIDALVGQYLRYCETTLQYAEGTMKNRNAFVNQLMVYMKDEGIEDIADVTVPLLDDFFAMRGQSVAPDTLNGIKRSVRMFFLWVEDYKGIELGFSPMASIKEKKTYRKRVRAAERSDIYRAIKKSKRRQDKLIIATMYETGMRIEELTNLLIENIHGEEIHVTGKGSKDRIVYVTPELAFELKMWFKENGWRRGHAFRPLMHTDGDVGYKDPNSIRDRIKDRFSEVGVEMHPHQLRHAFAIRLLKNGSDVRTIQKLLGHAKLETTMVYLNVTDPWLHKEYSYRFGKSAIK
jgi:site-specific recombinase XerD